MANLKWVIRAIKTHILIKLTQLRNMYVVFRRICLFYPLYLINLIFLWVLIFANLTLRNILRVFNFAKMAEKREEQMYLRILVLLM